MTEMERIAEKYEFPIKGRYGETNERLQAALREFGELACKAVCRYCRDGVPMSEEEDLHDTFHNVGTREQLAYEVCMASAIRKLMATEIERGEG